uniref:Uncharacterized protein n=1 Tax=Sphaerodactylus townsendi TaxID=933632 RepID=A0ACB8FC63_9SAUR
MMCDICCITFRTHRGLLRHNAVIHKQIPRDPSGKPFIQNNPSIPAGFHDLGFTDFSCRKFPRISQVWCETNAGDASVGLLGPFPYKENLKLLSLPPYQKSFIIQPDNSIIVKPTSETSRYPADLKDEASSATPQISLPPLSKAPLVECAVFKHMPSLKPKPLVAPDGDWSPTSAPPPLVNTQQASPGVHQPKPSSSAHPG